MSSNKQSQKESRVFYRDDPKSVVLEKNGKEVLCYKSVEELVEAHIKGLLAELEPGTDMKAHLEQMYLGPNVLESTPEKN